MKTFPYHVLILNDLSPSSRLNCESRVTREVLSVFQRDELITPADVIGQEKGLVAAIQTHGWPTLGWARGKVMFVIDGGQKQARIYENGNPGMPGDVHFVDSHDPGAIDAGYTVVMDAREDLANTQKLVRDGFMVRTR